MKTKQQIEEKIKYFYEKMPKCQEQWQADMIANSIVTLRWVLADGVLPESAIEEVANLVRKNERE